MSATKIPWADSSWNPIRYRCLLGGDNGWMCTKVSPGCLNCYAEKINLRFGNGLYFYDHGSYGEFRLDARVLDQPLHWRKPRRVFVYSMGDLFHEKIPFEYITRVFDVMRDMVAHKWFALTKRPCRMAEWIDGEVLRPHISIGVSVESEKYLYRINALNEIAAAVKFVSLEPLLEEIHIEGYLKRLSWVICGPETGPGRRPCKIKWIESIIEQCDATGVPVFVKALPIGKRISHDPAEWPEQLQRREYPLTIRRQDYRQAVGAAPGFLGDEKPEAVIRRARGD